MRYWLLVILIFPGYLWAQNASIQGRIIDRNQQPIDGASIEAKGLRTGTSTDSSGYFQLTLPTDLIIDFRFQHLNYQPLDTSFYVASNTTYQLEIQLQESVKTLDQIEISGLRENNVREQISTIQLDPLSSKVLPTPFGEFNKVLSTLPGVVSNNELSSAYSVRGGNFDENLVYVNDILVYRPFLIRAGQQEGLSFVNPDLVDNIRFSSGGWQAKYGDKLSSNLVIDYKKPTSFAGSATASLLGGAVHVEGASRNKKFSYLVGARHKRSQYLLNTLETQGEYLPNFSDLQSYLEFDLGKSQNEGTSSELGLLFAYSRNRYLVQPTNRETSFGNILDGVLRLFVAFDGQELMEYDTYQAGVKYTRKFNQKFKSQWMISGITSREREYFDLEGGYRLCDVNKDVGSADFDECLSLRGIGTNFRFARNRLKADVLNFENRYTYRFNSRHAAEFGVGIYHQRIDDHLDEFGFLDSADFVNIDYQVFQDSKLMGNQFFAYLQDKFSINSAHLLTMGVRVNYFDLNNQLLVSPRLQYSYQPGWQSDLLIKASLGVYQQPPFYRELRDYEGNINRNLKAQSSLHAIAGIDYNLQIWNRPFKFMGEVYYKYLSNVIPYDIDNVRVRYLPDYDAWAYAAGVDFRLSGEFVPGTQSWFSLGLLQTRENVAGDGNGFIRRPSDQFLNLGIFFEDHLPNDPTTRMNLHFLLGTGLPFGPPNDIKNRNVYRGEAYRRVDLGFSKLVNLKRLFSGSSSLWLGLEVLNVIGAENVISYTWIKDFDNVQYGIPNTLSARFLNVKMIVNY